MNTQTSAYADIPAHVPHALVREDYPFLMGAQTSENPFATMVPALHAGPDIIYSTNYYPGFQPTWVPRRLEILQALYLDNEHFSTKELSPFSMLIGESWDLLPIEVDPPQHTVYRALFNPLFTPRRLLALEGAVRTAARDTIATFKDNGECEFMNEFALRFPIIVFLDLMGLPRDRMEQFLEWEHMLLHSFDMDTLVKGTGLVVAYLREMIEARRSQPRDDLISFAVTARVDGRALNDDELIGFCFNMFIGGLDTVSTNVSWQIRHLAENPGDQQRLRANPALIPAAIEELYRRYASVTTFRTCIKQTEVAGQTIMPGDKIAMSTTLANTDPAAWERPNEVDFDRAPRHVTFGYGVHRCIGAVLARRESAIAIEELFAAIPEFRIEAGAEVTTELGPILQTGNLPLVWGDSKARKAAKIAPSMPVMETPAQQTGQIGVSIEEVTAFLARRLETMEPFGKTVKILLDTHQIVIDGTTMPPALREGDPVADVIVRAKLEDFVKILNKDTNPQVAMLKGKLKVKGDMMAIMALTKLL